MIYKQASHCLSIVAAILLSSSHGATGRARTSVKWKVEKNSTLSVHGETNMNKFTCNIKEYAKSDTIVCSNDLSKSANLKGEIKVDVLNFNCHNSVLTKGRRKTLKADEYPTMVIRFLSLQSMPVFQNKTETIKGMIELQLAGIVKRFELGYSFGKTSAGNIQLDGGRNFRFSDFKLSPPTKLGGLVKVKDEFAVQFQLLLRPV